METTSTTPAKRSWSQVVAVTWGLSAVLMTVLFYGDLGLRGLFWLWVHNALCAAGVVHELAIKPRRSR